MRGLWGEKNKIIKTERSKERTIWCCRAQCGACQKTRTRSIRLKGPRGEQYGAVEYSVGLVRRQDQDLYDRKVQGENNVAL